MTTATDPGALLARLTQILEAIRPREEPERAAWDSGVDAALQSGVVAAASAGGGRVLLTWPDEAHSRYRVQPDSEEQRQRRAGVLCTTRLAGALGLLAELEPPPAPAAPAPAPEDPGALDAAFARWRASLFATPEVEAVKRAWLDAERTGPPEKALAAHAEYRRVLLALDPQHEHDLAPEEPCTPCVRLDLELLVGDTSRLRRVYVPASLVEPVDTALDTRGHCLTRQPAYLPASQRSRILRSVAAVLAAVKAAEDEADDDT
jgi:hypothetical protein